MQKLKPNLFRGKPVVRFHVMAKPIGPTCNLDCEYCFYLSKENLLNTNNKWVMSDEVLETFIRQYINNQNYQEVVFSWQGGEPTLLGLEFFRKVVALEKKHAPLHVRCENDLQTNGILLNDEWCEFLKKNNFLVGLSIDGPQELHDIYRKDKSGKGTFERVFRAAQLLKKHKVPFNALVTINRENSKSPLDVYRFLRDEITPRAIQFSPCVEPIVFTKNAPPYKGCFQHPVIESSAAIPGNADSVVTEWSVNPIDYGDFLCSVFDEWHKHDIGKTFVYNFECALSQWMGRPGVMCRFGPICGKALAVEHDGSVYSCDHFVYPEYELGNIEESSLHEMVFSDKQQKFGYGKRENLPECCKACKYLFACNGGCPKERFLQVPGDKESGLNYLCSGLKKYFRHIAPHMDKMVSALTQKRRI